MSLLWGIPMVAALRQVALARMMLHRAPSWLSVDASRSSTSQVLHGACSQRQRRGPCCQHHLVALDLYQGHVHRVGPQAGNTCQGGALLAQAGNRPLQ